MAQYNFEGWAVVEWECCIKNSTDGAIEGAEFVKNHMIHKAQTAFDDFAAGSSNNETNEKILGLK